MSICLLCVWLVMVACYRLYLPPSPLLPAHYHCQGQTCTICVLVSVSQCSPGWRPTNTGGRAAQPRVQGWWWLGDIWLWYNPGPATASPAQARALSSTYQQTGNWLASWTSPLLSSPLLRHYDTTCLVLTKFCLSDRNIQIKIMANNWQQGLCNCCSDCEICE